MLNLNKNKRPDEIDGYAFRFDCKCTNKNIYFIMIQWLQVSSLRNTIPPYIPA